MKLFALAVSVSMASAVELTTVKIDSFANPPEKINGDHLPEKPMELDLPDIKKSANSQAVLQYLGIELTPEQMIYLTKNHFLLLPIEFTSLGETPPTNKDEAEYAYTQDEMLNAFRMLGHEPTEFRKSYETKLVTPDIAMHAWHRSFHLTLEYTESRHLHRTLNAFLESLMLNLSTMRAEAKEDHAQAIAEDEARMTAAWILLGEAYQPDAESLEGEENTAKQPASYEKVVAERLKQVSKKLPKKLAAALEKEIALILAHKDLTDSPLFGKLHVGKPHDYTQYLPRSHYTKSSQLGGYFRAMMYLGRHAYPLEKQAGLSSAFIIAHAMSMQGEKGTPLVHWKNIMEVTSFFAGLSDDISYPEFCDWYRQQTKATKLDATKPLAQSELLRLLAATKQLRKPQINSNANTEIIVSSPPTHPEFRIFGQRFTWDGKIFQELLNGSPAQIASLPTVYYGPAAFGDAFAESLSMEHLSQFHEKAEIYQAEFKARLPKVKKTIAAVSDAQWFDSISSKHIHCLSQLAYQKTDRFPHYMRGDAFAAKNIASICGSYTQLKHDTVLYAKQNYAENGDGGMDADKIPPVPKGFVQPDIKFWRELERMAKFTAAGMKKHNLLPDSGEEYSRYNTFADDIKFLRSMAEKEIDGSAIQEEEWERIRTLDFSYMATPILYSDMPKPGDGKNALVTDVVTDAVSGKILMEGLGRPYVMLALLHDKNGPRLVTGMAYNHQEFTRTLSQGRMTDEEWRKQFYNKQPSILKKPVWHPLITAPIQIKKQ